MKRVPSSASSSTPTKTLSSLAQAQSALQNLAWDDLMESSWLSAPADDKPWQVLPAPSSEDQKTLTLFTLNDIAPGWAEALRTEALSWIAQPVRTQRETWGFQAVVLGEWRFRWNQDESRLTVEKMDPFVGWAVSSLQEWGAWWYEIRDIQTSKKTRHDAPFVALGSWWQQMGRHAQRRMRRGNLWSGIDLVTPLSSSWSWWPIHLSTLNLHPEDMMGLDSTSLRARIDRGLVNAWRQGSAGNPSLRALARAWLRFQLEHCDNKKECKDAYRKLDRLLAAWPRWKESLAEHPRADLLLPHLWSSDISPGRHVWSRELWVQLSGGRLSDQAWRWLRYGDRTLVSWATSVSWPMAIVRVRGLAARADDLKQVPKWALDAVPVSVWELMVKDGSSQASVPYGAWLAGALKSWGKAARSRTKMAGEASDHVSWASEAKEVWHWLEGLPTIDGYNPSWAWSTFVDRWRAVHAAKQDWGVPFQPCWVDGVRIVALRGQIEFRAIGHAMKNCLKSSLSNSYKNSVKHGDGILVHLKDNESQSLAYFLWDGESSWHLDSIAGSCNEKAKEEHKRLAQKIGGWLDRTVAEKKWTFAHDRNDWLAKNPAMKALDNALNNPAWSSQKTIRPIQWTPEGVWQWLNDDEWWTNEHSSWLINRAYDRLSNTLSKWSVTFVGEIVRLVIGWSLLIGVLGSALRWLATSFFP